MESFGARSRLTQPNAPFQTSPLRNESFRSSEESWLDRPDRRFSDTAVLQPASLRSELISPTKISPTDQLSQTDTSAGVSTATPATLRYNSPVDLSTIAHSFTFTDPSSQQSCSSSAPRVATSRATGRKSTRQSRGRSQFRRASTSVETKELERKQRELLDSIFGPPLQPQQTQQPQQSQQAQQAQHRQDFDLVPSHRTVPPVEAAAHSLSRVEPKIAMGRSNSQQPSSLYRPSSDQQRYEHVHQQQQQRQEPSFGQSVFKVPELPASSQSGRNLYHPTLEPSSMPDPTMMQGILSSSVAPQTGWPEALTQEPSNYGDYSQQNAYQHLFDPSSQVHLSQPPHANLTYPPLSTRYTHAATHASASTLASAVGLGSGPGTSAAQPPPVQATPSHISSRHPHEPWNLRGSCACFHVQYSIHVKPAQLPLLASYCHCTVCRSLSGSNYVAFASVPTAQLRWYAGMPDWRTGRGVDVTEELAAARWRLACGLEGKASGADYASDMSMMMTGSALDSPNFTTVADRDGAVGDAIRLWSGGDRDAVRGSCVRCGSTLFVGYHKEKVVPSLLESASSPMLSPNQRSQQSQISPSAPADILTTGVDRRVASVDGYRSPHPSSFSPSGTTYSPGPVLGSRHTAGTPFPVTNGRLSQPGTFDYHQQHHQQSSSAHSAYHAQVLSANTHTQSQQQRLRKQQTHYYKTAASITDVALGSLCDAEDRGVRLVRPVCHVMLRERACWDDLPEDGLLRFDGLPGEERRSKASMAKPKRPDEGDDDGDDENDDEDDDEDDGNDEGNDIKGGNGNSSGWGGAGSSQGAGNSGGGSTSNQGTQAAESRNNSTGGIGRDSGWASWDFGLSWADGSDDSKEKPDPGNNFDATESQNGKHSKGKGRDGNILSAAATAGMKQGRSERSSNSSSSGSSSSNNVSTKAAAAKSLDESMRNLGYLMKCVWVYGGY